MRGFVSRGVLGGNLAFRGLSGADRGRSKHGQGHRGPATCLTVHHQQEPSGVWRGRRRLGGHRRGDTGPDRREPGRKRRETGDRHGGQSHNGQRPEGAASTRLEARALRPGRRRKISSPVKKTQPRSDVFRHGCRLRDAPSSTALKRRGSGEGLALRVALRGFGH